MNRFAFLFLIGLLMYQVSAWAGRDDDMEPAKFFFIPEGNPAAGKQAFSDLKCTTCHQTADHSGAVPVAVKLAPTLGATQAEYPAGWIANSIVSPSHTIALDSDGQSEGSKLSRMPDFTSVMTVRQLFDIVAYIKSQGEPAA